LAHIGFDLELDIGHLIFFDKTLLFVGKTIRKPLLCQGNIDRKMSGIDVYRQD
jgi:hypothetical protein